MDDITLWCAEKRLFLLSFEVQQNIIVTGLVYLFYVGFRCLYFGVTIGLEYFCPGYK